MSDDFFNNLQAVTDNIGDIAFTKYATITEVGADGTCTAKEDEADGVTHENVLTLAHNLQVGDKVVVGFVDNSIYNPVILAGGEESYTKTEVDALLQKKINEPINEGTNGQVLTTDGEGGRTWETVQGGGSDVDIVTSWEPTPSDTKVPSEKLTKDTLDTKVDKSSTTGLLKNDGSVDTTAYSTFDGNYNRLTNKPTIPSKISDLTNDSDFIEKSSTNGLVKNDGTIDTTSYSTFDGDYNNLSNKPTIPSASSTTPSADTSSGSYGSGTNYARSNHTHPKSSLYAEATHTHSISDVTNLQSSLNAKANSSDLGTVATSNSYDDLDDIPSSFTPSSHNHAISEVTNLQTSLDAKAPKSHASSATTYGVGTTANYGHCKTVNSLTQSSHSNGLALSAYQGYVLKSLIDAKSDFSGSYNDLTDVPTSFPPTSHNHDDRYYTESETNNYDVDFVLGTQTTSTSAWTGTTDVISSLREGTTIFYKLPYASTSTSVTLNLTLKGGGTTGAKNVFYKNTTRLTTHFGVGQVVGLVYNGTAWYVISPSDNNSNNDNNYGGIQFKAGEALTTQTICCAKDNGQYYKVANGVVLDIRYPLIMTSTAVTSGTTTNAMYRTWYGVNIANTKSMTLTNGSQLFLEGTAYSNGKFTISSNVVTHTLTNGRYYIKVGTALSTTQIRFISDMTVYYYNGTTLKPVIKKDQIVDFPTIPSASSTTPLADTTSGSIGTGTAWARSDHTHPKSSLYAEASHTHSIADTNLFDVLQCVIDNFDNFDDE